VSQQQQPVFNFTARKTDKQRISSELKEVTALRREGTGDNGIKILDHSVIGFNYNNQTFVRDPLLYCRANVLHLQEQAIRRPLPSRYIILYLTPHLKELLFINFQHVSLPSSDQTVYI
jgi:hypothetical protein